MVTNMRMQHVLTGLCVVALLTGSAFAQGGRGGGRGGRGFGGATGILSISEVQKELGLTEDQIKKVKEIQEAARKEQTPFDFAAFQKLSDDEKKAQFAERMKKAEETNKKTLEEVSKVLDAKQLERFGQLRVQREGLASLNHQDIADKLALTQEQKDKIKALNEEARTNARGFGGRNQTDEERTAARAKAEAAREKLKTDVLAVLTADQKTAFEAMKGTEFKFPMRGRGRNRSE